MPHLQLAFIPPVTCISKSCYTKLKLTRGETDVDAGVPVWVAMSHTVSGLGETMREKDFGVGPYKPPRLLRIRSAPAARPQPSGVRFVRSPSRGSTGGSQDTLNQTYTASLVRTQGALIRKEVCTGGPPAAPAAYT